MYKHTLLCIRRFRNHLYTFNPGILCNYKAESKEETFSYFNIQTLQFHQGTQAGVVTSAGTPYQRDTLFLYGVMGEDALPEKVIRQSFVAVTRLAGKRVKLTHTKPAIQMEIVGESLMNSGYLWCKGKEDDGLFFFKETSLRYLNNMEVKGTLL